jgi:CHAD domain-containing protein
MIRQEYEIAFDLNKPLHQQVKYHIKGLVEESIDRCNAKGFKRHEAVHDIRKNLKKVRAILRLVRHPLDDQFKKENHWYRDAGRLLSDIRDSTGHLEILQKSEDHYHHSVKKVVFTNVREQLQNHRRKLSRSILTDDNRLLKVKEKLITGRNRIAGLSLEEEDYRKTGSSIKKVYKRGRKAFAKACDDPTAKNYHQWRKRVKYLLYQLRSIHASWPAIIDPLHDELQQLSDYLGDDHDLAELQVAGDESIYTFKNKSDQQVFTSLLKRYSRQLRRRSEPLGQLIYAEKPKHFASRISTYLEAPTPLKFTDP